MKRILAIGLVVLTAFAVCTYAAEKKKMSLSPDEEALTKIENEWGVAMVKLDFVTFDRIVSPDWLLSTPDGGHQTKAEAVADLKSGKIKFESFKVDELKIRIYGNAAVVFGLTTEKMTIDGQPMNGQNRFTDTFIKRDGKWQCVATHVTAVPKK